MEDQELVEVWQSEFESLMAKTFSHRSLEKENGHYIDRDVFYWFTGFLLAKRSQPSVVLPKDCNANNSTLFRNGFLSALKSVKHEITTAGIKYTVSKD